MGFQPGVCQETWTPATSTDILMFLFFSDYDSCLIIDKLKYSPVHLAFPGQKGLRLQTLNEFSVRSHCELAVTSPKTLNILLPRLS